MALISDSLTTEAQILFVPFVLFFDKLWGDQGFNLLSPIFGT